MSAFSDWAKREEALDELLRAQPARRDHRAIFAAVSDYARAIVDDARLHAAEIPAADVEQALSWLLQPVFVCGHHRSGTTLLQELLDAHPQLIVIPTEVTYFASSPDMATGNPEHSAVEAFAAEWVMRLIDPNGKQHFHLGRASPFHNPAWTFVALLLGWQAALQRHPQVPGALAGLLALAAAYRDVSLPAAMPLRWVEKTPLNERHAARLATLPGARFIQLVRDPAATLRSQLADLRGAGIADVDAAEQAWRIVRSLRLARRNRAAYARRYLIVRYEDLVAAPEAETERVREFLQLEGHEGLLRPTVLGRAVPSNSSFQRSTPGSIRESRPHAALAPAESQLLAAFNGGISADFGYAGPASQGLLLQARRGTHFLRVALRAARRRLRVE